MTVSADLLSHRFRLVRRFAGGLASASVSALSVPTRKGLALALVLGGGAALIPCYRAQADSGIYKGYVVVDSGQGNIFYNLSGGTTANFSGLNLGSFDAANGTLTLNGFEVDTYKSGSSDVTGAYGDYRFYKQGSTVPGFSEAYVPFNANNVDNNSTNQKWQSTGQGTNLLAGPLDVGTYNFEVFERASTSDGSKYLSNNGGNYIATFTVGISNFSYTDNSGSGSTATAANWSTGRAPGNGHNVTLASTSATALTNTLTSANSLSIASGAGPFTISGSGLAVATTISNASAANQSIGISLSGAASLTQSGGGTLTLSADNTFVGSVTVSGGTLSASATGGSKALGGITSITLNTGGTLTTASAQQFNSSTPPTLALAGGTLNTSGTSQTLGALTLSTNSTIDLGNGASILNFGGTSTRTAGLLTIANWSGNLNGGGTDEVIFANQLSSTFLSNIQFTGYGVGAMELGNGEIVPVPEPATLLGGILCAGLVVYRLRRPLAGGLHRCHGAQVSA